MCFPVKLKVRKVSGRLVQLTDGRQAKSEPGLKLAVGDLVEVYGPVIVAKVTAKNC